MSSQESEAEKNIEIWKVKKLIKSLEMARGNGTSMISLVIPPKGQISLIQKMLTEEYGTASNIKSRVNRLSVLSAITSTQQKLKLYNSVPRNGLVVYCGDVITEEGKEKKLNIDFEPFKPINTSLYLCDNKFHVEALNELLENDDRFGFIIMDGNGALFGAVSGNTREVLHKFTVDLPKKHGRGGQSAVRFSRLREEKRHNYVRKVAEVAVQNFITADKVNVKGLILAGSADFKTELNKSDLFDNRLQAKVIKIVDISYGGENGFNQAIELSAETLANVKFVQEKKLLNEYFEEMVSIVFKYEGYIDKFMGDGLMAFFGDPIYQEDHTIRCVRAAIEMQHKVRELKERWSKDGGLPIKIRIGVHSGDMIVGNMGSKSRMDYTVLGANVNLTQRLESNAPVEGILISEAVYEKVKDRVETKHIGEINVKGLVESLTVYEVII